MVKRVAKYGFRSGILPKTRQIVPKLKVSWEKEKEAKANVGFVDPAMVPKGSHPNPPARHVPSAAEKIQNSAKEPKTKRPDPRSAQQEFRILSSAMRRKYFVDALETQEVIEQKKVNRREQKFQEAKQNRLDVEKHEVSKATKLTLPTIESFLNEPMVVRRTPEETAQLQLKREANRKMTEIEAAEHKSRYLLEIYQKADDFIINEEELNKKITTAFSVDKYQSDIQAILYGQSLFSPKNNGETKRVQLLQQTLTGSTSNFEPGLPEVQDALSGLSAQWQEEVKATEK